MSTKRRRLLIGRSQVRILPGVLPFEAAEFAVCDQGSRKAESVASTYRSDPNAINLVRNSRELRGLTTLARGVLRVGDGWSGKSWVCR